MSRERFRWPKPLRETVSTTISVKSILRKYPGPMLRLRIACAAWVLTLLTLSLAAPLVAVAQNMIVYDDVLTNGWQDYGYATENYSNTSPVYAGGAYSISVTISSAYQGIQIHHGFFSDSNYTSISFWLNG